MNKANQIIIRRILSDRKISIVLILLLAALMRFYQLPWRTSFDADQEFYAVEAKKILIDHKLTLIGIPTSIGGLFVAPLYTYLVAFSFWLSRMEPLAGSYLAVGLSLIGVYLTYLVAGALFNYRVGIISALIMAFSTGLIRYDITAWPVNPLNSVSLLLLWLLYKSRSSPKFFPMTGLVIGLGFHFHLAALVYLPITFAYFLVFRPKITTQQLIIFGLLFFLLVSPLFIFDLRHQFLISSNFLGLISGSTQAGSTIGQRLAFLLDVTLTDISMIVFHYASWWTKLMMALVLIFSLKNLTKSFAQQLVTIFILVVLFSFTFYKQHIPEYYLLPINTSLIMLVAVFIDFLGKFFRRNFKSLFLSVVVLILFGLNFLSFLKLENGLGLAYKKQAAKYIVDDASGKDFYVSYLVERGYKTGFDYLFYYYGHQPVREVVKPLYNIVIPSNFLGVKADIRFGNIGIKVER